MSWLIIPRYESSFHEPLQFTPRQADGAFKEVRRLDPYRIWDMDLYSTLLWHLQGNVRLSFLAQEMISIDPKAPQAWIAVGNCFSLQKERSKALSCFLRASQLDPNCCIRVHSEWSRVYRRGFGTGDGILPGSAES